VRRGPAAGVPARFHRPRRVRGSDGRSNGHQWPWGAVGLKIAFKGIFIRGNQRGN
jgi:hypothetical protein